MTETKTTKRSVRRTSIVPVSIDLTNPRISRTQLDRATAAHFMTLLRSGDDVRARKTRRTRAAIKVKTYENDLKLDVAIDRLLDELAIVNVDSLK